MRLRFLILLITLFLFTLPSFSVSEIDPPNEPQKTDIKKSDDLNVLAFNSIKTKPALSLSYSTLSLSISLNTGYSKGQIKSLILMGMVYKNIGAYDKSLTCYFNALRIARNTGDKVRVSTCLNNIGSVFQKQENFVKALTYFEMSLKIEEELNNKEQLSIRLFNIGDIYATIDSLDLAYTYYFNSLLIEEKLNNKEGIYYALNGISSIETKMGRFETAMKNSTRALRIVRTLNDPQGMALCHNQQGELFVAMKQYRQALTSFDSSLFYAQSTKLLYEMKVAFENLSKTYYKLGQIEKAYVCQSRYIGLSDTLSSLGIKSRVAELELSFQVEQKEKELDYFKEMSQLKSQKADSERRNRNFLLITIILAMLMAVYNLKRIEADIMRILVLILYILGFLCLLAMLFLVSRVYPGESGISGFFNIFIDLLMYSVLPLFILIYIAERVLFQRYIKKAGELTQQIKTMQLPKEDHKIELQFEGKEATLSINLKDLICFEANDNYTDVYYLKEGHVKKELRRASLKKIEDQLTGFEEIIRCHKSFIINLKNVSHVSGNAQGYRLHLHHLDFEIPVSRKFPQSVIKKIKSGN